MISRTCFRQPAKGHDKMTNEYEWLFKMAPFTTKMNIWGHTILNITVQATSPIHGLQTNGLIFGNPFLY